MMTRSARSSLGMVVALVALGVGASGASATTFMADPLIPDTTAASSCTSPCALRQAITDANKSAATENMVEMPPGTYTLTLGSLLVEPKPETKPETTESIVGLATHASEVVITAAPAAASQLMRVGVPRLSAGEALVATVEMTGGSSQAPGGAIEVLPEATLTLFDTAVEVNKSKEGGGIITNGKLTVLDSLIAHNEAVETPGIGGGIDVASTGSANVANSTIMGNTALGEGGGINNNGSLKVISATIAGNRGVKGGGLAGTTVELFNSIVAQNKSVDCAVAIVDPLGHNLADDASCALSAPGDKETGAGLVEESGLPLLANNGGRTETIALQSTSPAIAAGNPEVCLPTDQREVERPRGLCDIGAYQFSTKPTSSGGGQQASSSSAPSGAGGLPPQSPPPLPPPILARTGDVSPASGRVLVRLPGTKTFVVLSSLREIPFGTVIDVTHGRVTVTTAGPHGGTQKGEFFAGEFVLTQGRNGLVVVTLTGGDFAVCPTARERGHRARASATHASGKHVVRKLWANAHGSFSTKGNYAAGAVEGTEWLTEDLCDGTVIRVTRDKVAVTNLVNHHRLTVRAGHSYLAKAP